MTPMVAARQGSTAVFDRPKMGAAGGRAGVIRQQALHIKRRGLRAGSPHAVWYPPQVPFPDLSVMRLPRGPHGGGPRPRRVGVLGRG